LGYAASASKHFEELESILVRFMLTGNLEINLYCPKSVVDFALI
jgi:hypothetical protein